MPQDWLVGRDRRDEATERIYAAAADLISRNGFEAFTIEALARKVHGGRRRNAGLRLAGGK